MKKLKSKQGEYLMTEPRKIKVLLAYDGSHLAVDSVQYVGDVFPSERTQVVIFYVETKLPKAFWCMEKDLDFRFKTPEIRAGMAERKKNINLAMDKAKNILLDAGFPADAIQTRVHIKKHGIVQDIVEESYHDYDAIVMGRKGKSPVKDFFVNSLPVKLLGRIKNIPLIVVGKKPEYKNILIAYDGTRAITKAVKSLSSLVKTGPGCKLMLCYSQHKTRLIPAPKQKQSSEMFDLSVEYLMEAGFTKEQVAFEIIEGEKNPTCCILNKARYGGYGTIVIGRRGLSTLKRLFFMRVGNKIFRNAGNHVVWVVQ